MMVLQQYNRFSAALTISFHNMLGLRICQVMQQFDIYLTDDAATLSILYTVTYYSVSNIGVVCIYTQPHLYVLLQHHVSAIQSFHALNIYLCWAII